MSGKGRAEVEQVYYADHNRDQDPRSLNRARKAYQREKAMRDQSRSEIRENEGIGRLASELRHVIKRGITRHYAAPSTYSTRRAFGCESR